MTQIPEHLRALAERDAALTKPTDKVEALRAAAADLQARELDVADREEALKNAKKDLATLKHETLPDLLDAAGTDRIGLPASGNHPAADVIMKPYYRANIAADWAPERRQAAFDALIEGDAGDLIKHTITLIFGLGQEEDAHACAELLKTEGYDFRVAMAVPHTTLTAFVREEIEAGCELPLATLGATVGRVAELKIRKT